MNLKEKDEIVVNPDYYRKKGIPPHTLRGVILEVKWGMFLVKFDNGLTEWIDSKSVMPRRVYDTLTSKT
jgi:hypothetical protein